MKTIQSRLTISFLLLFFFRTEAQQETGLPFFVHYGTLFPYARQLTMHADEVGVHPVLYWGPARDTLHIFSMFLYPPPDYLPDSCCIDRQPGTVRFPLTGELRIIPFLQDTTDMENPLFGSDSIEPYIAFPIMLKNDSPDTLAVGRADGIYFGSVSLVLEGKDENGNWRGLTREYSEMYRQDKGMLVLPPGYIVATASFLYKGSFETDLRFRLGGSYSEAFRGWVNPEAFPE